MADWSDTPPALRPLIQRFQAQSDALMDSLLGGALTPAQWQDEMGVLIGRYHAAALRVGQQDSALSDAASGLLEGMVAVQMAFLGNFAHVVRQAGPAMQEYAARFRARARTYGLAIKTAYQHGDIIRQVGRPLPLPAMPAQGTQCGNNCLCSWRIEPVEDGYDAYWQRSAEDSCQTCLERERLWNPVRIRDGRLLVDYSLKHLAGQHDQMTHGHGGGGGFSETVYHGSGQPIDAFSVHRSGSTTDAGKFGTGLYFSPQERIARSYAIMSGGPSPTVHAVRVNLKNPLRVSGDDVHGAVERTANKLGVRARPEWDGYKQTSIDFADEFASRAVRQGHDGVLWIKNGTLSEVVSFSEGGVSIEQRSAI